MNCFKQRNQLKTKINFLFKNHKIEDNSIFLGFSYIQCCKNINPYNLHRYTLCAIMLANKYLNDYNYNIHDVARSLDIKMKDYVKIELELLQDLNWDLSMSNKVKYNTGDIEKIDTLMKAGLEDSDIVIVHSSTDIETLFIAQKSKIDTDKFIFMVLEDLSLADVFESLGFIILDSHNLKITKLLNKLGS